MINATEVRFLDANCSVQMISPRDYERFVYPREGTLRRRFPGYGIHHCGSNMHLDAVRYAALDPCFSDIGWGSNVAACRKALPATFLNLRLSPVRMLDADANTVRCGVENLLAAAGPLERTGVCCMNMDASTPDANVRAVMETAAQFPVLAKPASTDSSSASNLGSTSAHAERTR
jgi:hypothetical protein